MRYDVYRATIVSGASAVSKIERLERGEWNETDLSKAGKYVIPLQHASTVGVRFPAAMDGTNLRFKDTYDPYLAATASAGGTSDAALDMAGVNNWKGKSRTCPAELLRLLYVEPVLTDSSGVAQAQSQATALVFMVKAPTAPGV